MNSVDVKSIELSKALLSKVNVSESKWYNGRSYMPLYVYSSTFQIAGIDCSFKYEHRSSFFNKSSVIGGDMFKDRHIVSFTLKDLVFRDQAIEVMSSGFFKRLLFKNKPLFDISCSDNQTKAFLNGNNDLKNIYELSIGFSEMSPYLRSAKGNEILRFGFQNNVLNIESITLSVKILTSITEFLSGK